MDKLQPIIRQRFWILLVLCIVLGTVAYFKGQGALVAATQAREELLAKTKSGIPTGNSPNDDYKAKMAIINDAYGKRVAAATRNLFDGQTSRMWWPDMVKDEIPAKHRDPEQKITPTTAVKYATVYSRMIEDLWKKVDPVVPKQLPGRVDPMAPTVGPVTWTQKVYCAKEDLPQKLLPRTPNSDAIWDAQEDIWFVELVLEAIHNQNRQADSPLNAVIRTVERLELLGGAGRPEGGGDSESADSEMDESGGGAIARSAMGAMGGMGGMGGASYGGTPGGAHGAGGMGGMGGMAPGFTAPVMFNPAEELGDDTVTESEGESEEESTSMPTATSMGGMGGMGGMGFGGGSGMPGLRWVAKDDAAPFRERGFYLSVVMQQSHIPDFMIELTSSPWPIKVLRFQMGPNPRASAVSPAGRSGMGGMGGMAGRGMPMPGRASGGMPGMSSMGSMGGRMGMGMGGRAGYGGMGGMGGKASRGAALSFINTEADPFPGALNSPDLVQLDLVGIITFYVPQNEDGTAAVETPDADTPEVPEPVVEPTAEGEKTEGAESTAPADGVQPGAEGAAGEAPAGENPEAQPAAEPSQPGENPAAEAPAVNEAPPPGDSGAAPPPATEAATESPPPAGDESPTPPPGS